MEGEGMMNELIRMIKAELKHAEKKHPYFQMIRRSWVGKE